jgi:hypothetical protein
MALKSKADQGEQNEKQYSRGAGNSKHLFHGHVDLPGIGTVVAAFFAKTGNSAG